MRKVRTILRPPTNRGKNTEGGDEAVPDVRVFFHPDNPTLSPTVPTDNVGGKDPPAGSGPVHAPTETAAPESATPMAIDRDNRVSNRTWPTECQGSAQKLAASNDSDITLATSSGANNKDSDYVGSRENPPAVPENSLELIITIK